MLENQNINENINFDENDEITDEVYYSDNEHKKPADEDDGEFIPMDDEEQPRVDDGEYKVTQMSETFLKCECNIKDENSKTVVKFTYKGESYRGVCMQKLPSGYGNYVFLVQPYGKGQKKNAPKMLKKIYVPEASLIS